MEGTVQLQNNQKLSMEFNTEVYSLEQTLLAKSKFDRYWSNTANALREAQMELTSFVNTAIRTNPTKCR